MPEMMNSPMFEAPAQSGRGRPAQKPAKKAKEASDLWRRPIDLSPEMTKRLLHGLAENHRRRLEVFARQGARVSMSDLLAVTGDRDLRVLSYFQGALSRKLRRLFADREKKVHLIGWDYATTRWNEDHSKIVDGICYVAEATRESLRQCLGVAQQESMRSR